MLTPLLLAAIGLVLLLAFTRNKGGSKETIRLLKDEEIRYSFNRLKIRSWREGMDERLIPNCSMILTNKRAIIAQNIPLSRKKRIHFNLWYNFNERSEEPIQQLGVINLQVNSSSFESSSNGVLVIPLGDNILQRLNIPVDLQKIQEYL